MKLNRSKIIAAMAFLCLLAGSLNLYGSVVPKDPSALLRAIEGKTSLPESDWGDSLTSRSLLDVAMDKMVEQQEVEEAAQALTTLKNIQFTGVTILGDMELKGIVEPFINTPMTYEQMLEIGMVVESYYRKNNYLARAILPPQDLTNGVLTVDVIESVFSKLEIEQELADLPNTQAHLDAIIQAQQPTSPAIGAKSLVRDLTQASDLPGVSEQVSLRQGREAGETELLLKLYQGRTRQAELTMENAGPSSTGFMRVMESITWFNANDFADMLNLVAMHTRGSDYARLADSLLADTHEGRMDLNQQDLASAFAPNVAWVSPLLRDQDLSAIFTLTADPEHFVLAAQDWRPPLDISINLSHLGRPQSYCNHASV